MNDEVWFAAVVGFSVKSDTNYMLAVGEGRTKAEAIGDAILQLGEGFRVNNLLVFRSKLASGIEAPSGDGTRSGSTVGESPAGAAGDAQTPPSKDQDNAR